MFKRIKAWLNGRPELRPNFVAGSFRYGKQPFTFTYLGCEVEEMRSPNGMFKHWLTKVHDEWVFGFTVDEIKIGVRKAAMVY